MHGVDHKYVDKIEVEHTHGDEIDPRALTIRNPNRGPHFPSPLLIFSDMLSYYLFQKVTKIRKKLCSRWLNFVHGLFYFSSNN